MPNIFWKAVAVAVVLSASACGSHHVYEVKVSPTSVVPRRVGPTKPVRSLHLTTSTTVSEAVLRVERTVFLQAIARNQTALRLAEQSKAGADRGLITHGRAGSTPLTATTQTTSSAGGCYAQPYVPAYIVTRESRGDPTIVNGGSHAPSPYLSGGRSWGCFQFMPGTWNGSCSDLGFDIAGQIECARRVSNNGTNLRPWRL